MTPPQARAAPGQIPLAQRGGFSGSPSSRRGGPSPRSARRGGVIVKGFHDSPSGTGCARPDPPRAARGILGLPLVSTRGTFAAKRAKRGSNKETSPASSTSRTAFVNRTLDDLEPLATPDVVEEVEARDAESLDSLTPQVGIPFAVSCGIVLLAVDFDGKACAGDVEVDDVGAERMLAANPRPGLVAPEFLPQHPFAGGERLAKVARGVGSQALPPLLGSPSRHRTILLGDWSITPPQARAAPGQVPLAQRGGSSGSPTRGRSPTRRAPPA